ncbi:MAG: sulfatase-like hydrolase/transferase [Planctomycetaceae bacterium]
MQRWTWACSIWMALCVTALTAAEKPNIVLIYFDDLGYGDVSCYGATALATPQIDRIAREGLRFTDGHAPSATCTPSRYAMLTGEYAWRKKGTGIAKGDAALIIEPGRTTMASILNDAGYATGVVGKWHLGLGNGGLDWNGEIKPGPLELGFDECFLIPATGDRVPCVYVENHHVVGLDPADPIKVSFGQSLLSEPTGKDHPELLKLHPSHGHDQTIINGISRIGYMEGGQKARWVDEDMADTITRRAVDFIDRHQQEPFFLFFSLHDIHVPRVPNARFAGQSGLGPRGDVILQGDWCVGEILDRLDALKLADNTLVILSSDNGPVVDDGYQDQAVQKLGKHKPTGPWRGGKYSIFEGGTRVPFIARWPGRIQPGTSDAMVCQVDFPATFAKLVGQPLDQDAAPDSINVLPALLGGSHLGRDHLIEHAGTLALREGTWKLIESGKGPKKLSNTGIESGQDKGAQLYDLSNDLGEQHNVAAEHTERVQQMQQRLNKIRSSGRSR